MTKALNPKKLEALGVRISYEEVWDGEPGVDRHSKPDPTRVRSVFLNLSPEDWCRIAMHEGDEYIGGCCGTASAMQDVVNGIFREGGFADADDLYTLGEYAKHHPDGFEDWAKPLSQEEFDKRCARWKKLKGWDKITLCWHAVAGKIKPHSHNIEPIVQENRPDLDERREIDELFGSIHYLRYSNFFKPQDDGRGQHHANDLLVFAKLYPGTKRLFAKLEADGRSWSGFAIVEKARPEVVCHNGYGACVYNTEADAREVIKVMDRDDRSEKSEREKPQKEDRTANKILIRPVTISVKVGLVFTDSP